MNQFVNVPVSLRWLWLESRWLLQMWMSTEEMSRLVLHGLCHWDSHVPNLNGHVMKFSW